MIRRPCDTVTYGDFCVTSLASCWQRILPAHSDSGRTAWSWCFRCRRPSWHGCARCLTPLETGGWCGISAGRVVLPAWCSPSELRSWVIGVPFPDELYRISPSAEVWSRSYKSRHLRRRLLAGSLDRLLNGRLHPDQAYLPLYALCNRC